MDQTQICGVCWPEQAGYQVTRDTCALKYKLSFYLLYQKYI